MPVEHDGLPNNVRLGAEEALPEALAKYSHRRFAWLVFFPAAAKATG